jgi:hypothetical protein
MTSCKVLLNCCPSDSLSICLLVTVLPFGIIMPLYKLTIVHDMKSGLYRQETTGSENIWFSMLICYQYWTVGLQMLCKMFIGDCFAPWHYKGAI